MTRYTVIGLLLIVGTVVHAQSYNNIAQQLGITAVNDNNEHGAGTSCVDFNQDGADDLTFATDDQIVTYRNVNGLAQLVDFGFEVDDNAKHPIWLDYDNDGDLDFYFTQSLHPNKLYRNDNGTFNNVTFESGLPLTNVSSFGCSWADYDRDGDLDLFECTYIYTYLDEDAYDWHNHLYQNNGDGTFTDVTLEANVSDGISLSFQSIWADFNNDLWPDLYVINDLEHPNRLYLNNADGTFTESAEEWNAAVTEMDAMTASVGDFNNDGWSDIFITNTSIGHCALLKNNGTSFEDIASDANVTLSMLTWGAAWFDADLDMDLDLYVCENNYLSPQLPNPFLRNNGSEFFTNQATSTFFFDMNDSYSVATMDWNNDGRPDIAVNNFAPQDAAVWTSNQAGEQWIKLHLEGSVSNSQGIGAVVTTWVDGTTQRKQLYCGENYLGQNSNTLIFGLGNALYADSLSVEWPSGFVDQLYNIQSGQSIELVEGQTFSCQIVPDQDMVICEGDSISFEFLGEDGMLEWMSGSNLNQLWVHEEGEVSLTVTNIFGFTATSNEVNVSFEELPQYTVDIVHPLCFESEDGSISLDIEDDGVDVYWSDGQQGIEADSLAAGNHDCELITVTGCVFTSAVALQQPDPLQGEVITESALCFGEATGSAEAMVSGGVAPYNFDWEGEDPDGLLVGSYALLVTDQNGCEAEIEFEIFQPNELELVIENIACNDGQMAVDISTFGGTPPYQWIWSNGFPNEDFSGDEGIYNLHVTDFNGCQVLLEEVSCPVGVEEILQQVVMYPNPVSSHLTIFCPQRIIGSTVPIVNSTGAICKWLHINESKVIVSVDDLADGLYYFNGKVFSVLHR